MKIAIGCNAFKDSANGRSDTPSASSPWIVSKILPDSLKNDKLTDVSHQDFNASRTDSASSEIQANGNSMIDNCASYISILLHFDLK